MRLTALTIRGQPLRCRQGGQALLEWVLVMTLALIVSVWAASDWVHRVERAAARGQAQWLLAVSKSLEQMLQASQADPDSWKNIQGKLGTGDRQSIEPWLSWLTREGWLIAAMAEKPKAMRDVSLQYIDATTGCNVKPCPTALLLIASPPDDSGVGLSELLIELGGQALWVTELAPDWLQGVAYRLPNPPASGTKLPLGTVALMVWRSDREPPYVRLRETRTVQLDGGMVLGQLPRLGEPCQTEGLVMQDTSGQLLVCHNGRWEMFRIDRGQYQACLPGRQIDEVFRTLVRGDGLDMWVKQDTCECPVGYRSLEIGQGIKRFGSVDLTDGYLCERL